MFEMMAGSRQQKRTLEFFGLLALQRTPEKQEDQNSRREMNRPQPERAKSLSEKSLKPR